MGFRSWAVVLIALAGWVVWLSSQTRDDDLRQIAEDDASVDKPVEDEVVPVPDGFSSIGGVNRPATDVDLADGKQPDREIPRKRQGHSPFLAPDINEQVAQVAEALQNRENPERFSSFVVPHNFDAEQFEQSPAKYAQQYASTVEPGRVFAPAQPGEGVEPIRTQSRRFHRVRQGEAVQLSVAAVPNAPVTFSSADLGQFENQLTSITVVAGEDGVASANFTASGGTIDEVQVLAASPVTSGQAAFLLSVSVEG